MFDSEGKSVNIRETRTVKKAKSFLEAIKETEKQVDTKVSDISDIPCMNCDSELVKKDDSSDSSSSTQQLTNSQVVKSGDSNNRAQTVQLVENVDSVDLIPKCEESPQNGINRVKDVLMSRDDSPDVSDRVPVDYSDTTFDILKQDPEDLLCNEPNLPVQKKEKRKKKKRKRVPVPQEIASNESMRKYWAQRYRLFSRFDEGIKLDQGQLSFLACLEFVLR